jgi:nicotinamidase-related amidase
MPAALLVVDMLNPYDHEDADTLAENAAAIVGPLADLIRRAREDEVDLIYVNDNLGDFAATRDELVRRALDGRRPELVEPLVPPDDVAFLQKVRHSVFYGTALDHLLRQRELDTVILTGQVTEQCILYSALDAYVRHYDVCVVRDAVACIDPELGDAALTMMERNMRAQVVEASRCLDDLSGAARSKKHTHTPARLTTRARSGPPRRRASPSRREPSRSGAAGLAAPTRPARRSADRAPAR